MLYAHLDSDQQAVYDLLIADGVLSDTSEVRAWLPCTYCGDTPLYLLESDINLVWVQCATCLRRWWHDTGVGSQRRPQHPPGAPCASTHGCLFQGAVGDWYGA